MSDDILHTGRADIHHPKGPLTGRAGRSGCAEGCAWASHMRGGEPLYVQICMLCERINWGDLAEQVDRVRATALRDFAASMRALAEKAPEGEPASWPWSAYALAAVKAEERAGKGFPSDNADRTPDVGTPDPQRYWWQHDGCDSGPVPGAADWPGRPCAGCGMSLGGWTRGAPIAAEAP